MKNLIPVAIVLFTTVTSTAAHAIYDPSWERPLESADLKITDASGAFAEARAARLTLTKRDGEKQATGLVLELDGRTLEFVVEKIGSAGCGSKELVARQKIAINARASLTATLRLVDHAGRICEDYRPFRWEGALTLPGRAASELRFVGTPEAVFTIQSF